MGGNRVIANLKFFSPLKNVDGAKTWLGRSVLDTFLAQPYISTVLRNQMLRGAEGVLELAERPECACEHKVSRRKRGSDKQIVHWLRGYAPKRQRKDSPFWLVSHRCKQNHAASALAVPFSCCLPGSFLCHISVTGSCDNPWYWSRELITVGV